MKKIASIIIAAAILAGCATPEPTFDPGAAYNQEMSDLDRRLKSGQITELQLAERAAELARFYFPTDYKLHSLRDYKILLAKRLERGELRKEEFDYLWSEKLNALLAERQQLRNQMAAEEEQRRAAAAAMFLQRSGNAFRNAYQQPGTNCVSTPVGSSVSTSCY